MVFGGGLGGPTSGVGTTDFGVGGSSDPYPSVYQAPQLSVNVNGVPITTTVDVQLLGATVTYGLDLGVSSASIELTADPLIAKYSKIEIWIDAVPKTSPTLRFTGLFLRTDANLWPHSYTMVCKGLLYLAQQYQQPLWIGMPPSERANVNKFLPVGQYLFDYTEDDNDHTVTPGLIGGVSGTDQQIIRAILHKVSGTYPQLQFNDGDIEGTNNEFGLFSAKEMVWPPYRTALEMIQMFDQVCLGFRLHESLGGVIRRTKILGYPTGPADAEFTEGIDIWEGRGSRSVEQLCNSCYVEGATIGGFIDANGNTQRLIWAFLQSSNPFQPSGGFDPNSDFQSDDWHPVADQFRSPLIETSQLLINAGQNVNGLSADDVAAWRLSERNRELVTTSFVTFRDVSLFPGRTITVNSPHMAVTEPQWLQRVEVRVQAQPVLFQQTLWTIGGGVDPFQPNLPYTPPLSL